jgi:hypothetical protein
MKPARYRNRNPIKPSQDPFGLTIPRLQSKEEQILINTIRRKARQLHVLDDRGKIDSRRCHSMLEQINHKDEILHVEQQAKSLVKGLQKSQ